MQVNKTRGTKTKMTTKNNGVMKECIICGESFEDKTKPKNKKTCSRKCGDEARKARQRKEYREANPPKPNQKQLYYYDHYEYAFWNTDEKVMRNNFWKEDMPYSPDKIETIATAREMYDYIGGRRRRRETIDYNGDEKADHKVNVRFVESNREPSEVKTWRLSPEEIRERKERRKNRR